MKKVLLAAVALLSIVGLARAADVSLPVKAPPNLLAGYPYQGSGFYAGIGVAGEVLSASLATPASGGTGLYSAGAALDLTAGYQFGLGGNWYAVEASAQYTNVGGSVVCTGNVPCSVGSRWGFEQKVLAGFPVNLVLNALPNLGNFFPALPALPGGINASTTTSHPYLMVGVREDDISVAYGIEAMKAWKVQPIVGMGLRQQWTQGLVVDTSASCTFANTGFTVGNLTGANVTFGRDCRAALRLLY